MKQMIEKLTNRIDLTEEEAGSAFSAMVAGELNEVEIAALLVALRTKGEAPQEIAGAAAALRGAAAPFDRPDYDFVDNCGTGGDGAHTINVSTGAALLAAAMGIKVAKHGNRSISSKCGSADLLELLGVNLEASAQTARKCLDEAGICFFFAPRYHSGLRHAGPVRQKLKMRTVMNILGPLVNPASPAFQLLGVYDPALCKPMAEVLGRLGAKKALVVHGSGLDEVAVHGPTEGMLFDGSKVIPMTITPQSVGLDTFPVEALKGGTPAENTDIMKSLLHGEGAPAHQAALAINAGALAFVAGVRPSIEEGVTFAKETLKSGLAAKTLTRFAEVSYGA